MNQQIVALLHKLISDIALDESERKELDNWLAQSPHNRAVYKEILSKEKLEEDIREMLLYNSQDLWNKIEERTKGKLVPISASRKWWWPAAAAVLLVLFSVAAYFTLFNHKGKDMATTEPTGERSKNDINPGSEKAVLILADGSKIILDNTSNGTIAQQGNTVIMKEDGLLAYNSDKTKSQKKTIYNTLATARGQEFRSLVLADGTKVWLNSVSSITFPTAFIEKERIVEITGEVYFEVAKNPSRPFKVRVNGMEVEVLGTHFNINSYEDETAIKTTLLEGSVKIVVGGKASFLKPNQQASLNKSGEIKLINDADVNAAVAWKNGLFVFNQADIKEILRQISRWYDVDFEYKGDMNVPKFYGEIPRNVTLSEAFKIIEINSRLQFTIEGKRITVEQPD